MHEIARNRFQFLLSAGKVTCNETKVCVTHALPGVSAKWKTRRGRQRVVRNRSDG